MPAVWVSAAAAVYGASQSGGGGGGGSTGGNPNTYVPTNQSGMDQNFNGLYNNYGGFLNDAWTRTGPYAQQVLDNQFNNSYAPSYMWGATHANTAYGDQAAQAGNAANQMYGAANQVYQSAFDPRGDIYKQNVQQLQENTRAAEYARGIQMSPYGAAVEGNVMQNFQNDWQNQQLQRQDNGLAAMGRANQAGAGLGNTSGAMYLAAGQAPYSAANDIFNNQNAALSGYWNNVSPYMGGVNQLMSNALGYNNYGQSAANNAFNHNFITGQANANAWQGAANTVGQAVQGWWGQNQGNANNGYNVAGYGDANTYSGYDASSNGGWGIE